MDDVYPQTMADNLLARTPYSEISAAGAREAILRHTGLRGAPELELAALVLFRYRKRPRSKDAALIQYALQRASLARSLRSAGPLTGTPLEKAVSAYRDLARALEGAESVAELYKIQESVPRTKKPYTGESPFIYVYELHSRLLLEEHLQMLFFAGLLRDESTRPPKLNLLRRAGPNIAETVSKPKTGTDDDSF